MEAAFLIVLLGCSDDMSVCDPAVIEPVRVASAEECLAEAHRKAMDVSLDYPVTAVDCRPDDGQLLAQATPGGASAKKGLIR